VIDSLSCYELRPLNGPNAQPGIIPRAHVIENWHVDHSTLQVACYLFCS